LSAHCKVALFGSSSLSSLVRSTLVCILALLLVISPVTGCAQQQPTPEQARELSRLFQAGSAALSHRDFRAAIEAWQAGLDATQALNDNYGISAFTDALGTVYSAMGQYNRAIDYHLRALALKERLGDKADIARVLSNLGVAYHRAGMTAKSAEYYARCLAVRQQIGARTIIAITLSDLGSAYNDLGRYEKALELQNQALEIRRQLGNRQDVADSLNNVGNALSSLGEFRQAQKNYEDALAAKEAAGDKLGSAYALNNLGTVCMALGQDDRALDYMQRALKLKTEIGDRTDIANGLSNVGTAYAHLGRYDRALDCYKRALDTDQELGNKPEAALKLNNIGLVYATLGQNSKALEYYGRALTLEQDPESPANPAGTLENMGQIYFRQGDLSAALQLYLQTLAIAEKGENRHGLSNILHSIGQVYDRIGQHDRALEIFKRALALDQPAGNQHEIAADLNALGNVYKGMGDLDSAIDYYNRSLAIKKNQSNRQELAITEYNLAIVYNDKSQLDKAQEMFAAALTDSEALSGQVNDASQVGALQEITARGLCTRYAMLLLRQGKPDQALALLERGRGLGLARQAGQNRQDFTRLLPAEDADRLRSATEEYDAAAQEWRKAEDLDELTEGDDTPALKRRLIAIRKRYDDAEGALAQLRDALCSKVPAYRRAQGVHASTFDELTALAKRHPDTLYLEFAVGEEQSSLLFALSQQDGLKAFTLPVGAGALTAMVNDWRDALDGDAVAEDREQAAARKLYAALCADLEKSGLLAAGRYAHLAIVADGPLLDLAFAALLDADGKRLIERYPLSVSVSLGMLAAPGEPKKPAGSLLCVADTLGGGNGHRSLRAAASPLPAAREEGRAIAALFTNASVLIGDEGTREAVTKRLGDYEVLHFATRGALDDENGMRSGLVLAPAGGDEAEADILEAREIAGMPLSARMAVLSACETAQGQKSGGEGLLGLTWAFHAAGCPCVVASQWSVEDQATNQLMIAFYKSLMAGKRKDNALLTVKGQPDRRQPRYWAAFQVAGDTEPLHPPANPLLKAGPQQNKKPLPKKRAQGGRHPALVSDWICVNNRAAFDYALKRVHTMVQAAPHLDGLLLNDIQGPPAGCGSGNILCRSWDNSPGDKIAPTPYANPDVFFSEAFWRACADALAGPPEKPLPRECVVPILCGECAIGIFLGDAFNPDDVLNAGEFAARLETEAALLNVSEMWPPPGAIDSRMGISISLFKLAWLDFTLAPCKPACRKVLLSLSNNI
jgi:tetratricopeptide (TPR) repeat protein